MSVILGGHYLASFRCLSCSVEQPADFAGFVCPNCGHNLEVRLDFPSLRKCLNYKDPFGSGRADLFRYAPLLPLSDLSKAPPLRLGMTPLYHAPRLGSACGLSQLYLKDEGLNPSNSFKDRASAVAITRAREIGATVVAGASTGNAGSSMACLSASIGQPCVIFVPESAPPAKLTQLLIFGAKVVAVRGTYDQAFDLCLEVCRDQGWFNRNTGYNPFTREGKKTCSFELMEQLGGQPPDRVVVPTGDGNIISGIWKGFRDLYEAGLIDRLPRIDCAQANGSAAISKTVERLRQTHGADARLLDWAQITVDSVEAHTLADSISVDLPRDGLAAVRAVMESGGEVVTVSDEAILAAIPELARRAGVFSEPAAATAWAGLKQMAIAGRINPDERVVCLLTGSGLKDIGSARKAAGEPYTIDPNLKDARQIIQQLGL